MSRWSLLVLVLGLTACDLAPREAEGEAPGAAVAIIPPMEGLSLDQRLEMLQRELALAIREETEDEETAERARRAEAMSDRLLEAEPPVTWLASQYSVQSKLRQLQALADRIVADARRGATRERLLPDVRQLHAEVVDLRQALVQPGGGRLPPPLDSLLSVGGRDTATVLQVEPGGE